MPFPPKKVFVQFHSVDFCTEYHILFIEENWILKVKAVASHLVFIHFLKMILNVENLDFLIRGIAIKKA